MSTDAAVIAAPIAPLSDTNVSNHSVLYTRFCADSVECCPTPGHEALCAVGTYELLGDRSKVGQVYLGCVAPAASADAALPATAVCPYTQITPETYANPAERVDRAAEAAAPLPAASRARGRPFLTLSDRLTAPAVLDIKWQPPFLPPGDGDGGGDGDGEASAALTGLAQGPAFAVAYEDGTVRCYNVTRTGKNAADVGAAAGATPEEDAAATSHASASTAEDGAHMSEAWRCKVGSSGAALALSLDWALRPARPAAEDDDYDDENDDYNDDDDHSGSKPRAKTVSYNPVVAASFSSGAAAIIDVVRTASSHTAAAAAGATPAAGGTEGVLRHYWRAHDAEVWITHLDSACTPYPQFPLPRARTRTTADSSKTDSTSSDSATATASASAGVESARASWAAAHGQFGSWVYTGADDGLIKVWDTRLLPLISLPGSDAGEDAVVAAAAARARARAVRARFSNREYTEDRPVSGSSAEDADAEAEAEAEEAPEPSRRVPCVATVAAHGAGVCALRCHPVNPYLFASGSYDEQLMLWDKRNLAAPISQWGSGGGVWRIKWFPPSSAGYGARESGRMCVVNMYNGMHVVDTENIFVPFAASSPSAVDADEAAFLCHVAGETALRTHSQSGEGGVSGCAAPVMKPTASYQQCGPKTILYGGDWVTGDTRRYFAADPAANAAASASASDGAGPGPGLIAACSFYNKRVVLWSPEDEVK